MLLFMWNVVNKLDQKEIMCLSLIFLGAITQVSNFRHKICHANTGYAL